MSLAPGPVGPVGPVGPARPIDPLAPSRPGEPGVYRDEVVEVRAVGPARPRRGLRTVRTPHFDLQVRGDLVHVEHVLGPEQVDDDLAGLLSAELFGPGWLRGADLFERLFTGVVLSGAADPLAAWEGFYRTTLARVEQEVARGRGAGGGSAGGSGHGTIEEYAPVYERAASLVVGSEVLELGCCFGFLSLRLARAGWRVTASDVSRGTVALLERVAGRLELDLTTLVADAARYPGPDASADTVLVLHLLEHLEPDHGDRVVAEALRLARRRVVVAVPLEEVADETWGHVRTVAVPDLVRWGEVSVRSGRARAYAVDEHHGGWLVLDR